MGLEKLQVQQLDGSSTRLWGLCSFFYLVSLKDKWNKGFSRLGVVLKHLDVEPKRQERTHYEYNQAVVNHGVLNCLRSLWQISLQSSRACLFQAALSLFSSLLYPISCKYWSFSSWEIKSNSRRSQCDEHTWCHQFTHFKWLKWKNLLCIFYP